MTSLTCLANDKGFWRSLGGDINAIASEGDHHVQQVILLSHSSIYLCIYLFESEFSQSNLYMS